MTPSDNITVSVVIPARNERAYIEECLDSVFGQSLPDGRYEVIVVDGMSGDGTGDVVRKYAAKHGNPILLKNPDVSAASGLNRGIRAARGAVVARVDAHTVLEKDYLETGLGLLIRGNAPAAIIGGKTTPAGKWKMGKAVAHALQTLPGNGGAPFRNARGEQYTDTAQNVMFRKEIYDRRGGFREDVGCNEDEEFNFRALEAGEKIFLTERMKFKAYCRETLTALFRQYFLYGYWKPATLKLHPRRARFRHLMPPLWTLFLLSCAAFYIKSATLPLPALSAVALYGGVLVFFSAGICLRHGVLSGSAAPVIYLTMHVAYGSGFLAGILPALIRGRKQHDPDCRGKTRG